jgi:hypothetical protein
MGAGLGESTLCSASGEGAGSSSVLVTGLRVFGALPLQPPAEFSSESMGSCEIVVAAVETAGAVDETAEGVDVSVERLFAEDSPQGGGSELTGDSAVASRFWEDAAGLGIRSLLEEDVVSS